MTRIGGLFEAIVSRENLAAAAWRASRGKRDRARIHDFFADFDFEMAERVKITDAVAEFEALDLPRSKVLIEPCLEFRAAIGGGADRAIHAFMSEDDEAVNLS